MFNVEPSDRSLPNRYQLDLLIQPDTSPPAKYATSVDKVVEHDFTVQASTCRVCRQPRWQHQWVLYDGDTPLDCSERDFTVAQAFTADSEA